MDYYLFMNYNDLGQNAEKKIRINYYVSIQIYLIDLYYCSNTLDHGMYSNVLCTAMERNYILECGWDIHECNSNVNYIILLSL